MERKNHSVCGQPKIMTIKTAKTITTSRPTYHCHPERSAAESKDLVEVAATRRGSPRPLKQPSNYSQTTLKLPSNYPPLLLLIKAEGSGHKYRPRHGNAAEVQRRQVGDFIPRNTSQGDNSAIDNSSVAGHLQLGVAEC